MKNRILFALVGGLVLFVWQFLAFAMPAFHMSSMEYTPLQDELLAAIEATGLESGMYVLGQPSPEEAMDGESMEAWQVAHEGKGWARINFDKTHSYSMGLNMLRGLLVCMVIAWMLHALLACMHQPSLRTRLTVAIGVGFIGFLFIPYTSYIWFKEPDIWAHLLDAVVPWAALGALSAVWK